MILMTEEQMAREVTLGVIVTRPLTVWHYIIPGMFIIDFLRRGSALRKYTEHFMFPRKRAIDAVQALAQGQDEDAVSSRLENETRLWLSRDRFQEHIDELTAAEADVDRELIAKLGESEKLNAKISAEQKQLEDRRRKILEEVF